MNYELECQSSASALMVCTVSLWKSSHACSDGAKVLVRDSTGHHSGSTLFLFDCFSYYFTIRFLRGINRLRYLRGIDRWCCICSAPAFMCYCLLHPVEASQSSVDCHRVFRTVFNVVFVARPLVVCDVLRCTRARVIHLSDVLVQCVR